MFRTIKTLMFAALMVVSASCSKDLTETRGVMPPAPQGYVRASIELNVDERQQAQTRASAAQEAAYDSNNVWVLVFDISSDPKLMQLPVKAEIINTKLYALLRVTGEARRMYLVTGLSQAMNSYLATASNFTEQVTRYSQISNQLQTSVVPVTGVPVGEDLYFPMCSNAIDYSAGTSEITTISQGIKRIVARIDVDASGVASDFVLEGATLYNGAKKGFVLPQSAVPVNNGGTQTYSEATGVSSSGILSQIYLYENSATQADAGTPNPTTIIVRGSYKGVPGYYRLDVLDTSTGAKPYKPYAILRNFCYTIRIETIETVGYRTFAEALENSASNNIRYDVMVTDPSAFEVVSNGEYYLSSDVSEYIRFETGALTNVLVATVTTAGNTPASVLLNGRVTLSGDSGITLASGNLLSPGVNEIRVNVNRLSYEATISLRLGNLMKEIVFRRPQADAHYVSESLGTGFTFVERLGSNPQVELSNVRMWNPSMVQFEDRVLLNPTDELVVHLAENMSEGSTIRTIGETVIAQRGHKRVKIDIVNQQGRAQCPDLGLFGDFSVDSYRSNLLTEAADEGEARYKISNTVNDASIGNSSQTGRAMNIAAVATPALAAQYPALNACAMKNRDLNGNGKIDDDEMKWYLPSQAQLMAMWAAYPAFENEFPSIGAPYWSATQTFGDAFSLSFLTGDVSAVSKTQNLRVRCVRDL